MWVRPSFSMDYAPFMSLGVLVLWAPIFLISSRVGPPLFMRPLSLLPVVRSFVCACPVGTHSSPLVWVRQPLFSPCATIPVLVALAVLGVLLLRLARCLSVPLDGGWVGGALFTA